MDSLGFLFAPAVHISRTSPRPRISTGMRRARCIPQSCARTRIQNERGFVLPEAGDVVVYAGKWAGEDAAGLVEGVRGNVVDVCEMKCVGRELWAVGYGKRIRKWLDVGNVRVVEGVYVPERDAYFVDGVRDGYGKVEVNEDSRRRGAEEYRLLKEGMLKGTIATGLVGALVSTALGGLEVGRAFDYGAVASLGYLIMLQRGVDAVGGRQIVERLLVLRFALPIVPFLLLGYGTAAEGTGVAAWFGSVPRDQALAALFGLFTYKAPIVARTAWEFVDGLAEIQMGTTGMVGTVTSLAARAVRERRDDDSDSGRSEESTELAMAPVFVFAGPSGVGKSSLIHRLMDDFPNRFHFSVSHTTREPRDGEVDGMDYNFVDSDVFEDMIARGDFVEHAKVHGNYYGTSFAAVKKVLSTGGACFLDLDVQGVETLRTTRGLTWEPRFIWIAPPSLDALRDRLKNRGTETESTVKMRLDTATREMTYAATRDVFDLTVINEDFETAYVELRAFVSDVLQSGGVDGLAAS